MSNSYVAKHDKLILAHHSQHASVTTLLKEKNVPVIASNLSEIIEEYKPCINVIVNAHSEGRERTKECQECCVKSHLSRLCK